MCGSLLVLKFEIGDCKTRRKKNRGGFGETTPEASVASRSSMYIAIAKASPTTVLNGTTLPIATGSVSPIEGVIAWIIEGNAFHNLFQMET